MSVSLVFTMLLMCGAVAVREAFACRYEFAVMYLGYTVTNVGILIGMMK